MNQRKRKGNPKRRCDCIVCRKGMAAYRQWEAKMMAEYGFIYHTLEDDTTSPTRHNVHTHGLLKRFGHPDLQMIAQIPSEVACYYLETIVRRIKNAEQFKAGDHVTLNGYACLFVNAIESGRPVLRIIVPDKDGNLERDKMDAVVAEQYADLPK